MKCPICGAGKLVRESRDLSYTYGSRSAIIRQSGDYCDACGEGVFSCDESAQFLAAVGAFRAEVDAEPPANIWPAPKLCPADLRHPVRTIAV